MTWLGPSPLNWVDLGGLTLHFTLLSLLAVGGAITTAPDMQRYVVAQKGWLSDAQFTDSVALAQAAPGPNVLFVAVVGFHVAGLAGALAAMAGSLLPSTTLTLWVSGQLERHREARAVRAFSAGLAPLTLGLLLATGWILLLPHQHSLGALALAAMVVAVTLRWRISPLWLIAVGAALGAAGQV